MSIAVTAIIHPSRLLFVATHLLCALIGLTGVAIACDLIGNFSLSVRIFIGGVCVICTLFALFQYRRQQKIYRIDIAGDGTVRLATDLAKEGETVSLMKDSTLWSGMMLLTLRSEAGKEWVLRILPDTVPRLEFRTLSVALRWIAARKLSESAVSALLIDQAMLTNHG